MRSLALALASTLILLAPGSADAGRSRHERVKVEPLKEKGAVVGMKVTLLLKNDDGYRAVRVGIGPAGGMKKDKWSYNFRTAASQKRRGHLLHQWKAFKPERTENKTFEVRFDEAPNVVPGSKIEVITAWGDANSPHVWGMTTTLARSTQSYTVPKATKPAAKKPATAKKPAAKKPATAKKPAAKKPATSGPASRVRQASAGKPKKPRATQARRAKPRAAQAARARGTRAK